MTFYNEHGVKINNNLLEKHEQDLAKQYVQPNDVVFELGTIWNSVICN